MSTLVLCNGCFDLLHVGHIWHLREAKSYGDILVVSLTEDAHVNKGEGRPINAWKDRAEMLRALRFVDYVIASRSAVHAIQMVRPHVFVKGVDYSQAGKLLAEQEACNKIGARLVTTKTPKVGSSDIMRRIRECEFS